MGYSTDFDGEVTVTPPLNGHEAAYLRKFADTRRMARRLGPYFADGSGDFGQGDDEDILDYNTPAAGQPGLWCNWVPSEDGAAIRWNGGEKFHDSEQWMRYLIDTFLRPGCALQAEMASPVAGCAYPAGVERFTFDHVVDGVIEAQGDDPEDRWRLIVTANVVTVQQAKVVFDGKED